MESTAHTFGVGIVSDKEVLANAKKAFVPPKGGIHPREAAEHHVKYAESIFKEALEATKLTINDIDIIAFSQGPGLGPCLRIGAIIARYLSTIKYYVIWRESLYCSC